MATHSPLKEVGWHLACDSHLVGWTPLVKLSHLIPTKTHEVKDCYYLLFPENKSEPQQD